MKTMTVFNTLLLGTLLCILYVDNCASSNSPSAVNPKVSPSHFSEFQAKGDPFYEGNVGNGTATLVQKTVRAKRQIFGNPNRWRCQKRSDHSCSRDCQCGRNRNCSQHGWCQDN